MIRIRSSSTVLIAATLLLVPLTGALSASAASAKATGTHVMTCSHTLSTKPSSYVISCADANSGWSGVKWSSWTAANAIGHGTFYQNDCTPNCAQGHFHTSPVTIVVVGRQRCPNGQMAYQEAAYVPLVSGIPNVGDATSWFSFKCSPQP